MGKKIISECFEEVKPTNDDPSNFQTKVPTTEGSLHCIPEFLRDRLIWLGQAQDYMVAVIRRICLFVFVFCFFNNKLFGLIYFIEIWTWGQWAWFQLIKQQVVKKEMVLKKMIRVLQT